MSTWIGIIDWIISAVAIEVQTVNRIGCKIACGIGRNPSSEFGRIVASLYPIQLRFSIVVIASVSDRVILCEGGVRLIRYSTVAVSVIGILRYLGIMLVVNGYYIALQISYVIVRLVRRSVITEQYADYSTLVVDVD